MPQLLVRFCIFPLLVTGLALADDGAVCWSGAPTLLRGHRSIEMVSEKVILNVHEIDGESATDADCTFVFHNSGPECSVRIGFPDRGSDAYEDEFHTGGDNAHPKFQILKNFKSWVDGVSVKTTLLKGQDPMAKGVGYGGSWHVKVVHFKKGQTVTVRDTYTQPESGGITNSDSAYLNQIQYVMSTGGSWHGNIGSAEIDVHVPILKTAFPVTGKMKSDPYGYAGWLKLPGGAIGYQGFATPDVRPGELIFKRKNFKPTVASDIIVYWPNRK